MTDPVPQTQCPEPGCVTRLPAPEALGWSKIGDLWWCPLHAFGEQYRLRQQQKEITWYDGNIRLREQAAEERENARESVFTAARRADLQRQDPQVKRELARVEKRIDQALDELTSLRHNRRATIARHELENERRTQNLQFSDDISEK